MPLCARCTGMLIGLLFMPFFIGFRGWGMSLILIFAFAADSTTQACGFRESKNWLRLLTGIGFSIGSYVLLSGAMRWLLNTTHSEVLKRR